MGKTGGSSSWFTAVRKAFGSPTKKITNSCTATTTATTAESHDANKKTSKRREDHEQEDEEKKRGKRRWMNFSSSSRKSNSSSSTTSQQETAATTVILHHCGGGSRMVVSNSPTEQAASKQRHALAVAMATTAAAQAAVATAQAAVEVVRLANPSLFVKQHFAAVSIQTAFRGYLGRKALRALKGVVKLQALVRGQNVRRRAKLTLHCIQSLLRVQAQVLHNRNHHGRSLSPATADGGRLPVKHSLEQCFRDGDNYWDNDNAAAVDDDDGTKAEMEEEIRSILQQTHQLWSGGGERRRERELVRYASEGEVEEEEGSTGWTRSGQRTSENRWQRRASIDSTATTIKTMEMDARSLHPPFPQKQSPRRRHSNSPASPLHHHHSISSPKLPPLAQAAAGFHSRSGSPRYMAATESAKARSRSQSAPKQRNNSVSSPSPTLTSDHSREQQQPIRQPHSSSGATSTTAKKRLSFPDPPRAAGDYDYDAEYRLRYPSYMEQRSKMSSSSYTDSVLTATDEIISSCADPASNYEVNRWLLR